jgi:hypothetical protein
MKIQGYFDGTAVRPIQPLNLEPNQTVYIDVAKKKVKSESNEERVRRQVQAVNSLFNMLTDDEAKDFGKAMYKTHIYRSNCFSI